MATTYLSLTKAELVNDLSAELGITKKNMNIILDAIGVKLKENIMQGKLVRLFDIGTARLVEKKASRGYVPSLGKVMDFPAKKVIKLKATKIAQ